MNTIIIKENKANEFQTETKRMSDGEQWNETEYLLSSENNRKRPEDAIKNVEQGIYEVHDLIEE